MPTHEEVVERDHADDADRTAAAYLNTLVPVHVRVVRHDADPEWKRQSRRILDEGRVGLLRTPVGEGGGVPGWAYVTDLSPTVPGEDDHPSRYLSPRNLLPVREPAATIGEWSPRR